MTFVRPKMLKRHRNRHHTTTTSCKLPLSLPQVSATWYRRFGTANMGRVRMYCRSLVRVSSTLVLHVNPWSAIFTGYVALICILLQSIVCQPCGSHHTNCTNKKNVFTSACLTCGTWIDLRNNVSAPCPWLYRVVAEDKSNDKVDDSRKNLLMLSKDFGLIWYALCTCTEHLQLPSRGW